MAVETHIEREDRRKDIDIAKGIAIILVVIGHSAMMPERLWPYVSEFYMQFFFFVSGYLMAKNERLKNLSYIKSRVVKLINEYLMACFLLGILRICWTMFYDFNLLPSIGTLLSIIYGRFYDGSNPYIVDEIWSGQLWFMTCMCSTLVLSYILLLKETEHRFFLGFKLIIYLILSQMFRQSRFLMPWCIDLAFATSIVMCVGYFVGRTQLQIKIQYYLPFAFFIYIILKGKYDIHMRIYPHQSIAGVIEMVLGGVSGSIVLIYISDIIKKICVILGNGLMIAGKNSLDILVWHIFFIWLFKNPFNLYIIMPSRFTGYIIVILSLILSVVTGRAIHFIRRNILNNKLWNTLIR